MQLRIDTAGRASGVADANGLKLAYEVFGAPEGQPLLLIMGLGCQMLLWDEAFCSALAGRGYRVIRFDNRDVGQSTRLDALGVPDVVQMLGQAAAGQPVSAPYLLRDMAADAIGLLDALGVEHAHVVGASLGGMVAQTLAIHWPRRLRSITSIMSSSGDPSLPPPKVEALQALLTPTPTDLDGYVDRFVRTWKVLRGPDAFPEDEAHDPELARRLHARGIHPAGVARQLAAVIASGSRRRELASLRVPTLVIHGEADPLVPVECGIDVAEAVPGARLVAIPGMGHALPRPMWPRIIDEIADHAVWTD